MRTSLCLTAMLAALPAIACKKEPPPPAETASSAAVAAPAPNPLPPGEARLAVDGGRIWYRVVGSGNATPVILLHGGPGYSSFYMRSMEALSADRPAQIVGSLQAKVDDLKKSTDFYTVTEEKLLNLRSQSVDKSNEYIDTLETRARSVTPPMTR